MKTKTKNQMDLNKILVTVSAGTLTVGSAYCSILGWQETFASAGLVIPVLAVAQELGKVALTRHMSANWKNEGFVRRSAMCGALTVLMGLSAFGAYGFFTTAYKHGRNGAESAQLDIAAQSQVIAAARADIAALDGAVNEMPQDYLTGRRLLLAEQAQDRATAHGKIDCALAKIGQDQKDMNARDEDNALATEAKDMGMPVDKLAAILILALVSVFDPLAVLLVSCTASVAKPEVVKAEEPAPVTPKTRKPRTRRAKKVMGPRWDITLDMMDRHLLKSSL